MENKELSDLRKLIDLYHGDIATFASGVFGSILTPKQIEFCEAFRTKRTITFRGGVGFRQDACRSDHHLVVAYLP